ncbi:unnamed protein product [Phyllotreta striolata]|uniref:Protein hairless n=1 Tax=Phyllotreta striolata TaxID=444603 RepID=A0A9N9TNP6_PHYSR|nr:unnamed protein product [Phyllotreta striolata]
MHISSEVQHPPTTILTKCAKMSKEGHAFGMNGNVDGNSKEECHRSNYGQGGRLKFFKDGKFILELERAREGERVSWVSVPRKTFWPPQGTASSTPAYRQESSTSLSVSDDNSSIQSSPWQRDHSWKQSNPSRNLSKELKFYFWRPKSRRKANRHPRGRRRAPNSISSDKPDNASFVRPKKSNKKTSLLGIVQQLIDKVLRTSTPPRAETVVSPRKRFLREMEKDKSLQEDNAQKRSRNKLQTVGQSTPVSNAPAGVATAATSNGGGSVEDSKPSKSSSYSINSLLADDRTAKRSPTSSPNHYPAPQGARYCSPGAEDRWYSESVDRLRSIELSQQVDKCASFPPYSPQSYLHGYMYPFVPPYYGSGAYGRGYGHPVYPSGHLLRSNETPGYPWAPEARKDEAHREETVTDMPLNLSKNSG